jgi:hypothetical protein
MKSIVLAVLVLCGLAGCAIPRGPVDASPCAREPGGYDCQVERYMRVNH